MPFGGMLTAGLISGGSSIFSGIMGANASGKASKQYIEALKQAQESLRGDESKGLANFQPYLNAGSNATGMLSDMMSRPGEGLLTPWTNTFKAPTAEEAAQTPGYQFQLQQGENALQNSAAGKGNLLTGRTLADSNTFAQGLASSNYNDVFNHALEQYQSSYNTFLNNQNNTYSRLLGMSGQGLTAAGGAGNLISGIGGDIASLYSAQGSAAAGGTMGSANALSGMFSGLGNSATSGLLLSKLFGGGASSSGGGGMPVGGGMSGDWGQ